MGLSVVLQLFSTFGEHGLLKCLHLFVVCLIRAELGTSRVPVACRAAGTGTVRMRNAGLGAVAKPGCGLGLCFWDPVLWLGM